MAPEYFLKNKYKNKMMNDTSVGFVSPFQSIYNNGTAVYDNMANCVTKYG